MAYDRGLAERVRDSLAATPSVREVPMFGGLSFMVDDEMVVSVRDGDLLVRADPADAEELLTADGARPAEMGAGRVMGGGWISVAEEALATDEALAFWIGVSLEFRAKKAR